MFVKVRFVLLNFNLFSKISYIFITPSVFLGYYYSRYFNEDNDVFNDTSWTLLVIPYCYYLHFISTYACVKI